MKIRMVIHRWVEVEQGRFDYTPRLGAPKKSFSPFGKRPGTRRPRCSATIDKPTKNSLAWPICTGIYTLQFLKIFFKKIVCLD